MCTGRYERTASSVSPSSPSRTMRTSPTDVVNRSFPSVKRAASVFLPSAITGPKRYV